MRLKKNKSLEDLKKFGFKHGTRDKFIFKTKQRGLETRIYIDLLPCNNNNNEINIETDGHYLAKKAENVLFDIIEAGLVEK